MTFSVCLYLFFVLKKSCAKVLPSCHWYESVLDLVTVEQCLKMEKRQKSNVIYSHRISRKHGHLPTRLNFNIYCQLTNHVPVNIKKHSEVISPVVFYRHKGRRCLTQPGVRLSKNKTIITLRLCLEAALQNIES